MTDPGKSCTADNETMENLTQSCEYLIDDKALKKKLKKERQKTKRNEGKAKSESVPVDDVIKKSEGASKKEINETNIIVNESDMDTKNLSDNEDSDSADINFSTMVPAFIQSIVSQKDIIKKQKKHDSGKGKDSIKNVNHKTDTIFTDDINGFTCVKKGTKQVPSTFCKTPEGFGNEALRVIREGNFELAINYLNRGIALDRTDTRHYINRSYCYMRVGQYSQALADIKYASDYLNDILEMSRAKCREGQALCGLQEYEAAERAFKESINLAPDFLFSKRELKRMQIQRIVDMGFNERDAILALDKKPTFMEAINLLSDESLTNSGIYVSSGSPNNDDEDDDDDIFYSDTEEDPSNERLLSKLLQYDPNLPEEPYISELPPPSKETIHSYKQPPRALSQERTLRVIKAVPPVAKPKSSQGINEMAVWVGSLPPQISEAMVQKRFSRFGKITGITRHTRSNATSASNDASYAFVNFQCPTASKKVLEEAAYNGGTIEVNGVRVTIKPATNKTK